LGKPSRYNWGYSREYICPDLHGPKNHGDYTPNILGLGTFNGPTRSKKFPLGKNNCAGVKKTFTPRFLRHQVVTWGDKPRLGKFFRKTFLSLKGAAGSVVTHQTKFSSFPQFGGGQNVFWRQVDKIMSSGDTTACWSRDHNI